MTTQHFDMVKSMRNHDNDDRGSAHQSMKEIVRNLHSDDLETLEECDDAIELLEQSIENMEGQMDDYQRGYMRAGDTAWYERVKTAYQSSKSKLFAIKMKRRKLVREAQVGNVEQTEAYEDVSEDVLAHEEAEDDEDVEDDGMDEALKDALMPLLEFLDDKFAGVEQSYREGTLLRKSCSLSPNQYSLAKAQLERIKATLMMRYGIKV